MTEKRFKLHIKWSNLTKTEGIAELRDNGQPLLETECIEDARLLQTILNELHEEKEIAIEGIKIANDLINRYGGDELKHKWKKEVNVNDRRI